MVQVAHTSASFRLLQVSCYKPNWKLRFSSWLWQVLLVRQQVLPWLRFPKPPLFHWRRHQADPGHLRRLFWHNCSCSPHCQKIEGEERWWKWHFRLTPSCATLQGNMTFAERYLTCSQLCREGKYDNMEILHRLRKSGRGWTCSQSRVWTSGTWCFFHWYPPKKYVKPRLGESTLT